MGKADERDVYDLRDEYTSKVAVERNLAMTKARIAAKEEYERVKQDVYQAYMRDVEAKFGAKMRRAGVNVTQLQYIIGTKSWDSTTKWKALVGLNPSATREEDKTLRKISNVPGKPVWNEDYSEFRITEGPKGEALDLVFNVKDGLIMHTPQFPRTPYQIRHMKLMMDSIKAGQKAFGDGFFRVLSGILEAAIQAGKAEVEKK